ncbi:hypothetical protein I6F35_13030 [Bradyrhizobium sp. BRP22]|uniref:hypothetical protein n=1 Tax=Bradyrhizobium sp. BRP22 TaxID=2793821 RepID=UPI001CD65B0A|nr:hypothetical protein [Bradyrhizobium sp. BRP22]MCA1454134.1 hypothetical protein [Bradyrhizobium sp. BRP22]
MTVELIGIITLLAGLVGIFCPSAFIVTAFFCSTLLGSAAALTLPALGDTNIQPAHLLLGFMAAKLISNGDQKRVLAALVMGRPGLWLMLAVIWSAISAYFLPRLFAGQTFVFPTRTSGYSLPLAPGTSNLTQSIYLIGDFGCFILLYAYATTCGGRRAMENAALLCVVLNLAFAALDLLTYYANATELMSIIRNANYGLLNDTEMVGIKRIVGSFTEASSFGAATLGYFAFAGKLWLENIRSPLTLVLAGLSFLALLLSTSSTAYVGLAGFMIIAFLHVVFDAARRATTRQSMWLLATMPIVVPIVVIAIALNETSSAYVSGMFDELVFNKMSTASGVERSLWNAQGVQNFVDTFGAGVGNGSMRASSFPISVLASLGVIGAVTMTLFLVSVFLSRSTGEDRVRSGYRKAAKYACLGWLVAATVSGALVDLGLPFFAFAALACSRSIEPLGAMSPGQRSHASALQAEGARFSTVSRVR